MSTHDPGQTDSATRLQYIWKLPLASIFFTENYITSLSKSVPYHIGIIPYILAEIH